MAQRPPTAPRVTPAAAPSRAARTRERILAVSLDLFNTFGEAQVTTGHIADELNISPGNLYYHFRNKDEIIQYLFRDFERRMDVAPSLGGDTAADRAVSMEDLWLYLHLMFENIWDYRFLYRNLDDLLARDPKLKSHFTQIVDHKRATVTALCNALAQGGALKAGAEEIRAVAENVLVVASYWLNFQHIASRKSFRADLAEHEDLGRGVYQVMMLVAPYLHGKARQHLHALSANYIET